MTKTSFLKTADWALEKVDNGYLIKNMRYEEYFYAAAEDRAFDENRRSIFTWQDLETLGPEGIWEFSGTKITMHTITAKNI